MDDDHVRQPEGQTPHSPLPWTWEFTKVRYIAGTCWLIRDAAGRLVGTVDSEHEAILIVEAVNGRDALTAEVARLQRARIGDTEIIGRWMSQCERAEAQLADLQSDFESFQGHHAATERWVDSLKAQRDEAVRLIRNGVESSDYPILEWMPEARRFLASLSTPAQPCKGDGCKGCQACKTNDATARDKADVSTPAQSGE